MKYRGGFSRPRAQDPPPSPASMSDYTVDNAIGVKFKKPGPLGLQMRRSDTAGAAIELIGLTEGSQAARHPSFCNPNGITAGYLLYSVDGVEVAGRR